MKDIYSNIEEISDLLKNRECNQKIKEVERKMESNEEVILLVLAYEKAQREYSSSLNHYDEESEEVKNYQRILYQKKLELDSHPIVKEYYSLLKEVNEPLRYLEMKLLSRFKISKTSCK